MVLCIGAIIFFNPFEDESAFSTSTNDLRETDTPHVDKPIDDSGSKVSNPGTGVSSSLASIFELPTYFEQSVALDDLLKNASIPALVNFLDQTHHLQGFARQRSTQAQIFRKFVTLDPIQALSHANSFPNAQYEHFASLIYRDWSLLDLEEALTYAEQHFPTLSLVGQHAIFEQILRVVWELSYDEKLQIAARLDINAYVSNSLLAEIERDKPIDNPIEAWKELLSNENFGDEESEQLLQIAMVVIEKDGYSMFADLANAIPDRRLRTRLIRVALFNRLEVDEIGTVFEPAVQLFHESARPVLFDLAAHWCFLNPRAALNKMSTVPSDSLRKRLEEFVIHEWLRDRPMEVLQQLDVLPIEYRDVALTEGIWSMSSRHPKETTEYLNEISDPQTQWNVMGNLLQNWARHNIEEAFTWFLDNPDMEIPLGHSRADLLWDLLVHVDLENAPSLIELALKYPVDESGSGWEGSIVGELASQHLTEAKELLPKVREGRGRLHTYASIGLVIFSQERNMNSVIEFTIELPEEDHNEFYGILLPRMSPRVAYEQIDDVPTPQARAQAALKLLQKAATSSRNPYTDEQIEHLESFLTATERAVLERDSSSAQQ